MPTPAREGTVRQALPRTNSKPDGDKLCRQCLNDQKTTIKATQKYTISSPQTSLALTVTITHLATIYNMKKITNGNKLNIETEQDNVAILHHIFFPLAADESLFFGGRHGTTAN